MQYLLQKNISMFYRTTLTFIVGFLTFFSLMGKAAMYESRSPNKVSLSQEFCTPSSGSSYCAESKIPLERGTDKGEHCLQHCDHHNAGVLSEVNFNLYSNFVQKTVLNPLKTPPDFVLDPGLRPPNC